MPELVQLETPRLLLRQWREADKQPFAAMSANPQVMEFFPALLSPEQSSAMVDHMQGLIQKRGWGFWALELKQTQQFIGFTGLHVPADELPCSPCVEIGWRLSPEYWGLGLVTEAANAALNYAFSQLKLEEVVSFTVCANQRSRSVMERLGMRQGAENFEHPALPEGHPLREHVLYKISAERFRR